MKFSELVEQILDLLQRQGRVSYRALKRGFELDDDLLADLKEELLFTYAVQVKEEGPGLVWTGKDSLESRVQRLESEKQGEASTVLTPNTRRQTLDAVAERRQLTVLFCDLVGSTALSTRLDPEDLRTVVQQYQQTCADVVQRHEGYLAQYLGDGLLVYFGYPTAHEDDACRAVRVGLEIIEALQPFSALSPFQGEGSASDASAGEGRKVARDLEAPHPSPLPRGARGLAVRIGIHTGLVVIGEIGSSEKRELLALGETPNIAARIQGLAEPNTVIISAATQRLIDGQFESQPFGAHLLKGIETPIAVYHVQSERQSASPLAGRSTLTPLVGREQEVGLLIDRWEQAKEGRGQVVLLSGEPGIGKSRLAYSLREHVTSEGSLLFEARCTPYHQHSAFYPLIESFQRTLLLTRQDTDSEKVEKLERALALYNLQETLPLFATLWSLPAPRSSLPAFSPQKQKERTLQALLQLLIAQAERQATVSVWEDLHWADPSSLEFLSLLTEQIPTTKLLLVLTFRPEFTPPWKPRSHISQLVLNRLGKKQVQEMIRQVAALTLRPLRPGSGRTDSKAAGQALLVCAEPVEARTVLPDEVMATVIERTDGVPLFVEELTKSVIEARGQVTGDGGQGRKATDTLAIPATLQEALLARLDRLSTARQVAQLGATLGREFSHELIQAVTSLNETDLHAALEKLVEAEILYQRGIGEQARYFFKHTLIQDTAYQSLLKSARQQYHQQIAQVLEERFVQIKETQPELLAHHYTEAHLIEQAIPYWQQAGQKAVQRSANAEAISHLTKGLELLQILPDTPERVQQELTLQITLGGQLALTKGYSAVEVEQAYARAQELCRQVGETPQLVPVLWGLAAFYGMRKPQLARALGEQLLHLAESIQDQATLLIAHRVQGALLYWLGELTAAHAHLKQGVALYDRQQHHSLASLYVTDPGVHCLSYEAAVLWHLGYPEQALKKTHDALTLAHELSHPPTLVYAVNWATALHEFRREAQSAQKYAEILIRLCTDQEMPFFLTQGSIVGGWALAEQGRKEEGITQICQSLVAYRDTGAEGQLTYFLSLLAETYGKIGQGEEGLRQLTKAFDLVEATGECAFEAELYRLRGELTLQEFKVQSSKFKVANTQHPAPNTQAEVERKTEACFLKAIDIAQKQQAKSWELRASTSLARLWQSQGKKAEAHKLLFEIYNWFTEGFDTKDLQEAKALLDELGAER